MRFVRTVIWIRSVIFTNCLLWVRQNFQMSQLICCSKNSTASQNEQHDIYFILILNEAHDFSYSFDIHVLNEAHNSSAVRMQLCSLILFVIWYCQQIWYDLQFDIICSLILCAVWYCSQFDIICDLILFILIHSIFLIQFQLCIY